MSTDAEGIDPDDLAGYLRVLAQLQHPDAVADVYNGSYAVTTTVKVGGKALHAHGTLKIDCVA
jgi:hypothetical protein